jgi:uncharacterized protein (TIGR02145 family)
MMKTLAHIKIITVTFLMVAMVQAQIADIQKIITDTFVDPRNGKSYRTVKIGNMTWMAENLNFKVDGSWCYDNDESICQKFGRLYDWNTAMMACPVGWRLPDNDDWNDLVQAAGGRNAAGKKLKSKTGWPNWTYDGNSGSGNGTNELGFSALPGGMRYAMGNFGVAGMYGLWWSATEHRSGGASYLDMVVHEESMINYYTDKDSGLSVRCVQK